MAFIVEDGTGVSGATSYASVEGADAYFADRGETAWTGTNSVKQVALVRATAYVDTRFRFTGTKVSASQPLEFPRYPFGLPDKLVRAVYEYALRSLSGPLLPDPTRDESGARIVGITKTVGPITKAIQYADSAPALYRDYPTADGLLREYIASRQAVIR